MGGSVLFGDDRAGRSLKVREDEAERVRHLLDLYAGGMTIVSLSQYCAELQILSYKRKRSDESLVGGIPMTPSPLNSMLKNPIYRGKIAHKGRVYEGQQRAIINKTSWDSHRLPES